MKELVALDSDWVPNQDGCSLYIRPFMFAIDEFIGVKPAEKFRFEHYRNRIFLRIQRQLLFLQAF